MVHYFCAIVAQKQVSLLTHSDFIVIGTAPRSREYERQGADPISLLLSANGLGEKSPDFPRTVVHSVIMLRFFFFFFFSQEKNLKNHLPNELSKLAAQTQGARLS